LTSKISAKESKNYHRRQKRAIKRYDIVYEPTAGQYLHYEFRNSLQNMVIGSITYVAWQIVEIQAISMFQRNPSG
jgi:hypothetical protein